MKLKIKKGDTVEVISGREKGTRGEVLRVSAQGRAGWWCRASTCARSTSARCSPAGARMNPGIIQFEAPLHLSNVMLVCPKCGKPTRVGLQRTRWQEPRGSARTAKR